MRHHAITVPMRISLGLKYLHDLPTAHDSAAVESSSHHLREGRHIWDDVKILLRATNGIAKARHDFIKDQYDAAACRFLSEVLEKRWVRRDRVVIRAPGFSNDGRNVVRAIQRLGQRRRVIEWDQEDRALDFLWDTG